MKKLFFVFALAGLLMLSITPAQAKIYDVTEDSYYAMCWTWFDREYLKTFAYNEGSDTFSYSKFDIKSVYDDGLRSDTPNLKASYDIYITPRQGSGYIEVPEGKASDFDMNAYKDIYTIADCDYKNYVVGSHTNQSHTVGEYNEWVSLDITDIVRDWLAYIETEGDKGYENYGIEINNYDETSADWGWYWNSSDADSNKPHLEVVPIPGAVWLLGSGLLGLLGFRRKRK